MYEYIMVSIAVSAIIIGKFIDAPELMISGALVLVLI